MGKVGQFPHQKLRKLQRLKKIVARKGFVKNLLGQIHIQTVFFFLGRFLFFLRLNLLKLL